MVIIDLAVWENSPLNDLLCLIRNVKRFRLSSVLMGRPVQNRQSHFRKQCNVKFLHFISNIFPPT